MFFHSIRLKEAMNHFSFFIIIIMSLFFLSHFQAAYGLADPSEVTSLLAIKDMVGDDFGRLSNWVGNDPCGTPRWTGVYCSSIGDVQFVSELRLLNMNFSGTLAPHVGNFTQLRILNFMWNNLRGPVPAEIGKLSNLFLLLFDGNKFIGPLPSEMGNLSKLNRLQIDDNNLTGPLPPSFQGLTAVKHIHLNNNSLSGSIPKELGQLPNLLHLLLDNNNMSGELPPELSDISTLVILQLDNNNFTGEIPSSYTKLLNLTKLSLRNCKLSGTIPDLSSLPHLQYLDLSQNEFSGSLPALNSASQSLTTIDLSFNKLVGEVPVDYLQMLDSQLLLLQNNSLNGSIAANQMTHNAFNSSKSVLIVNLQNNNISELIPGPYSSSVQNVTFRLSGNPVCNDEFSSISPKMCTENTGSDFNFSSTPIVAPILAGCSESTCGGAQNQELVTGLLQRGVCQCAYPLVVGYRLKSPSFTIFPPYENAFISYFASGLKLQDYQIGVSQVALEPGPRLRMTIKLFPTIHTNEFEQAEVDFLYSMLSSWSPPPNNTFGPYELLFFTIGFPYNDVASSGTRGVSGGVIAGILVAAIVLTATVIVAAMFLVGKHRRKHTVTTKSTVQRERIKVAGVRSFSFQDMAKATNNFDTSMTLGQGGYGKVYKAVLDDGLVVAIKRAEVDSLQGSKEFVTEIELLSRVHHRNLVALVGYCDDEGEQMLVYEFMAQGTVHDHLDSGSKVPLDFSARLQIAIGAAKGILYLHTEANPPIYHRDIKASNILLDEKRRAKVADFGLSKLAPVADLEGEAGGYISTVVKGTPGYLDPEYFFTHMLTDKSDVYSFGVVLLELVTGKQPIYHGKNLVREVMKANKADDVLSMVDPRMGTYSTECILSLVRLAISCTDDSMDARPSMAEVVRVLMSIWQSTLLPDTSMAFSETSMDPQDINLKKQLRPPNEPYVSVDGSDSGLFSGVIPQLNPR